MKTNPNFGWGFWSALALVLFVIAMLLIAGCCGWLT